MPFKIRLITFVACFSYFSASVSAIHGQAPSVNPTTILQQYDIQYGAGTNNTTQYPDPAAQQQQQQTDVPPTPRVQRPQNGYAYPSLDDQSLQQEQQQQQRDSNPLRPEQESAARRERLLTQPSVPPLPLQLAAANTFRTLPSIFGRRFFRDPNDYPPNTAMQVPDNYQLAPGDEVLVRMWGSVSMNQRVSVDRAGAIYLPQVGKITVAGIPFSSLESTIRGAVDRIYRNYNLSVELGRLRSIQVFVTGAARQPGSYTVSSFSTLISALFSSGGPANTGSFRRIQLRRGGETVTEVDLYRFLRFGDKTKDVRLMPGDVIFIPPVGEQIAIGGSVKDTAVYELLGGESVEAALSLAGGRLNTAAESPLTIERIVPGDNRTILRIPSTALTETPVRNGDIIFVPELPPSFSNVVTLRGNVVQPLRFAWHAGLKLSDILPEKNALLTKGYWYTHNRLAVEPDFQPLVTTRRNAIGDTGITSREAASQQYPNGTATTGTTSDQTMWQQYPNQDIPGGASGAPPYPNQNGATGAAGTAGTRDQYPNQGSISGRDQVSKGAAKAVKITIPAPDIDWSYAVIERKDPVTLKSTLVPFNLGKLVLDHDMSEDKELQPEDVVTIFSQADVTVPREQQTKFVRVEGEVAMAGVYAVGNNESWADVLKKAGGLTSNAYPFGAEFTRESARLAQQQRLDDYIERLTAEIQHSVINVTVNGGSASSAASSLPVLQAELLRRLRNQKATGRVVLNTMPDSGSVTDLPVPEDGDVLIIPPRPSTVNVIGAVNNQSSYIFTPLAKAKYYLSLAGGSTTAGDSSRAFVIRANGSIVSAEQGRAFGSLRLAPGDTVVIPEKSFKINKFRTIFDSSFASQFAVVAAIISVIR
ncbi:sugar transporter [Terriglobus albidus]|uniref:Sugar transporter n=1 Tax=Terriglobus albidus TaxID=1592106 RepID=A0A5B9ED69_9BACT|nr:SLBB domain-containing protein [Terriglobus albidus]QEE28341.1 sugar transporter [Terriglobus albidus]